VDLDKLYGILNDGKMQMKVNMIMTKNMLRSKHISLDEFVTSMNHLEKEDQIYMKEFQDKNKIILQNLS
jgi:hypothetical protein